MPWKTYEFFSSFGRRAKPLKLSIGEDHSGCRDSWDEFVGFPSSSAFYSGFWDGAALQKSRWHSDLKTKCLALYLRLSARTVRRRGAR